MKPIFVFDLEHPVAQISMVLSVVPSYIHNGWNNKKLTKILVDRLWGTVIFGMRLLLWDVYKFLMAEDFMKIYMYAPTLT